MDAERRFEDLERRMGETEETVRLVKGEVSGLSTQLSNLTNSNRGQFDDIREEMRGWFGRVLGEMAKFVTAAEKSERQPFRDCPYRPLHGQSAEGGGLPR